MAVFSKGQRRGGRFRNLPCLEVCGLAHGKDSKLSDIPNHLNPSKVTLTLFCSRSLVIVVFPVMVPYGVFSFAL
jgi:hypothetical protein